MAKKKTSAKSKPKKHMVIVESPAKARTLHKYLGRGYLVKASMGHVRDLPKNRLGVDIEHDFAPQYQTIRGKGKTLEELRKALKQVDRVYLAPDPDREGEAIAWHLVQLLKIPEDRALRIRFQEITKRAVEEALKNPGRISMDRVNAQQARRILDRLVGYKLSPLLWRKIAKGLSAGRVQSVAVKLIVDREKEIRAFVPEEYWRVRVKAAPPGPEGPRREDAFELEVKKVDGRPAELKNEAQAREVVARLEAHPLVIQAVTTRERRENPAPPFATSTLQQAASTQLRMGAARTMRIAQQLYEGVDLGPEERVGLITYMRTDSFRVAQEAVGAVRKFIAANFGADYVPETAPDYGRRRGAHAQEAHEAIRPTDPTRTPAAMKPYLTADQYRLYRLIWERFVASQMAPARFAVTEVRAGGGGVLLTARGRVLLFDGFTRILSDRETEETRLPAGLAEGMELHKLEILPTQHFTSPPPRYTEASLVKALEAKGIGRPSTYATILSTITDRGYVELKDRKFHATELGILVTDLLTRHFPRILDTDFTSRMELDLDRIAAAEADWVEVLRNFYTLFAAELERAEREMTDLKKNPEVTTEKCAKCGSPMVVKLHKRGKFLACSAYPKCQNTRPLDGPPREPPQETDIRCAKCGSPMVVRTGRRGKFLACSAYPKCRHTLNCDDAGNPVYPEKTGEKCPKCGADMILKFGRRGRFQACSAYPRCRFTKPLPAGHPAES